jgi:hypothetical protein
LDFSNIDQIKINAFCCECCRLIWDELSPIAQHAVQVAEDYVAGLASLDDMEEEEDKLWRDLGTELSNWQSRRTHSYRAAVCCLFIDESQYEFSYKNHEIVTGVMEECNKVKQIPQEVHYQLMRETFLSAPE